MIDLIPMVVDKNDIDGNYSRATDAKLFINKEPIARTLHCKCGGGQEVHHNNMVCVAMRGRGDMNEQRLEPNTSGTVNSLTTVQKDNLVLEKKIQKVGQSGDITPTITAEGSENINYIETEYRIRKLTPKECWRLMGYTDEDFEKAHNAGVSNSQLYKQAGNAIVKQVLMAIFSQML